MVGQKWWGYAENNVSHEAVAARCRDWRLAGAGTQGARFVPNLEID